MSASDSEDTLRRIIDATRYLERLRASAPPAEVAPTAQPMGAISTLVQCTSSTPNSYAMHFGKFTWRNTDSDSPRWYYGDDCILTGINDEVLEAGVRYTGIIAGIVDYGGDEGYALVIVTPSGASGEVDDSWKNVVRCSPTGNVSVASPGAVHDGVTMSTLDTDRNRRMLLRKQTTASENGLYQYNGSGVPLTRTTDADDVDELLGAIVFVSEGTANRNTIWCCITDKTITPGTTATVWVELDTLLCEVTVTDTGSGHTVKVDTYAAGITPIAGPITLSPCYSTTGSPLPVGTRVVLFRIANLTTAGYWIMPAGNGPGFHAALTATASGFWSWTEITLDAGGLETLGTLSGGSARPLKVDGTNLCNPVVGDRVWMFASKRAGCYEFLPYGYASQTFPGLVSITSQTFAGDKAFYNTVTINSANNNTVTAVEIRDGLSPSPYTSVVSTGSYTDTGSIIFHMFGSVPALSTGPTANPGRLDANVEMRLAIIADATASTNSMYWGTRYSSGSRIPTFKDHNGAVWQCAIPMGSVYNNLLGFNGIDEWAPFGSTDPWDVMVYDPLVSGAAGWGIVSGAAFIAAAPAGQDSYGIFRVVKNAFNVVTGTGVALFAEYPGATGSFTTVDLKTVFVQNGIITSIV